MADENPTLPDASPASPTMDFRESDVAPADGSASSLIVRIARGTIYGIVLLAATALLAVSAVPDLARFASFLPGMDGPAFSDASTSACGSSCTTLDQVAVGQTSCPSSAANVSACCLASGASENVVALTTAVAPCCESIGLAALLARTADVSASCEAGGSCCESSDGCLVDGTLALSEEPIDAGSLVVSASTEQPADEQPAEEGNVLEPDQVEVEE